MPFDISKYHFNSVSLLDGLPISEYNQLIEHVKELNFKKGKLIFREGSHSNGLYILKKGRAKLYKMSPRNKQQIAYIYGPGDAMGHRPILCDSTHPASASALEDCHFSFISRINFLFLLDQLPVFTRKLLINLSQEFSVWVNKLSVFSQAPARVRVAISLLILREKYRTDGSTSSSTTITLSREDLANYSGTTVETLVRMLRQLKDENIISSKGRNITIIDTERLELSALK